MSLRRSLVFLAPLAVLVAPSAAGEDLLDYVVGPGENCESISAKVFGDPQAYTILHSLNPQLGPMPHNLKPGTVLKVPRPGPDAHLTFLRNKVEAATPAPHPGAKNEPLLRGHRVTTQNESSAEITFKDQTRLQLGEETLVIVLGSTSVNAAAKKTAADTTLLKGSLRAHLGELAGKKPAVLATPGAKVDLSTGEAKLHVDDDKTARLAVYKGKGTIASAGKAVDVPAGFGSKALLNKAPTPPKPLPPAPVWTQRLPRVAFATADTLDFTGDKAGRFDHGKGPGPTSTKWHVQVSRDERFNDLVADAIVAVDITRLEAKGLVPGKYYARVSGYDGDKFEGPFGEVLVVDVVRATLVEGALPTATTPGKLASVFIEGTACAVDGGALAVMSAPVPLSPGKDHVLTCAEPGGTASQAELALPAAKSGPLVLSTLAGPLVGGTRKVTLIAKDATGMPVDGLTVQVAADDGLGTSPISAEKGGTYSTVARFLRADAKGQVRFTVSGKESAVAVSSLPDADDKAPTPAATAPRKVGSVLGVGLGGHFAADGLGTGGSLVVEEGARIPLGAGALYLLLQGGLDRFGTMPLGDRTVDGSIFRIGLPLSFAFFDQGPWSPYLGASLGVRHARLTTDPGSPPADGRTGLEGRGFVGLRYTLDPRVALFVEGGYRKSREVVFTTGSVDPSGFGGVLGVHLRL